MCFDTRMRSLAPADIALFIADDSNSQTKNLLRQSFRKLRHQCRPPEFTFGALTSVHDDMYFGDSRDSIGIQLADLCGYFIAKHLEGDNPLADGYYQIIKEHVVCGGIEPK